MNETPFISINPYTEETLQTHSLLEESELKQILENSQKEFEIWKKTDFSERSQALLQLKNDLEEEKEILAQQITVEMGKPIIQSRAEIQKCADLCEFYAKNGGEFLSPELIQNKNPKVKIQFEPLGIILGIMPWNFPFWQIFRFAIPTLMAGNAVLIKSAPNVTTCSLKLEKIFKKNNLLEKIFKILPINLSSTSGLIQNPKIQGISFTGSVQTGKIIAAQAGQALKKTVLELGGSDPFIILEDADISIAAKIVLQSRFQNAGQSCIAAKRVLIPETIAKKFTQILLEKIELLKMGNPLEESTTLGPLARRDLRETVHAQVQKTIQEGGTLKTGGTLPTTKGFFYPPTLLTDIQPNMLPFREEIFGPVLSISIVKNEEQAIEWANATDFGLGATVFTQDEERGEKIASEINAGSCFVNGLVQSNGQWPFGGIKQSGHGRELSRFGTLEFVNVKTVVIA